MRELEKRNGFGTGFAYWIAMRSRVLRSSTDAKTLNLSALVLTQPV